MSPSRIAHPCGHGGCPALVTGSARCAAHTVTREQRNPHDPDVQRFYDSTRWKKVRAIVRRNQPICMDCQRRPSQCVDHLGELNDLRLEMLQALCWPCHNRKSGAQHAKKRLR